MNKGRPFGLIIMLACLQACALGMAAVAQPPQVQISQGVIAGKTIGEVDAFFNMPLDRKSTRLNSSHVVISYAVFCLKKKKKR